MSLSDAWENHARAWIAWARSPDHDSYWQFHRDAFLRLVPEPGSRPTLDIGCGEGRLARDLVGLGHRVVALDRSFTLSRAAHRHHHANTVIQGDGAHLPVATRSVGCAVAFMSVHDMDEPATAVTEISRVLARPGGRLVMAVVHPLNSAGAFAGARDQPERPFVIEGSYLAGHRYAHLDERDGLTMTFESRHHSLEAYAGMLESAGLVIEAVREPPHPDPADKWARVPLFLHLRARKI